MPDPQIEMLLVDGKKAVDSDTLEYVPFGVKTLKLRLRKLDGPAMKLWIRARRFKRDEDPCQIYGIADDSDDLWVVWGAGDIMGLGLAYQEKAGTKVAVPLDDDAPRYVYLHLVHRPDSPQNHQLRDLALTVVAVTTDLDTKALEGTSCRQRQYADRVVAERTFRLKVPALDGGTPLYPAWQWGGTASEIRLRGDSLPLYVSRWWPARELVYQKVAQPPRISLTFWRTARNRDVGEIEVWLGEGAKRQKLAHITGHLTLPVYDTRTFLPELYRFYDGKHYALRLWFFWTDEHISGQDLLRYVPAAEQPLHQANAEAEAARLMKSALWGKWPGWGKQYEIPDLERFDIVFDPGNLAVKYGCTDAHWREFWSEIRGNEPFQGAIAAPRQAHKVILDHALRSLKTLGQEPVPPTNPLEEGGVVARITGHGCHYDEALERIVCGQPYQPRAVRAPGLAGKNAPLIRNGKLLPDSVSSDVLEG